MKKRKYSFSLLMGGIYALLSLFLLVSFSGAKFADRRTAYPAFQAADFNVAILLKDPAQEPETTLPDEDNTQVLRVNVSRIRPGMVGERGLKIPFYVSNGTPETKIAGLDIRYTVRVRTDKNIPLTFSLIHTRPEEEGGSEADRSETYRSREDAEHAGVNWFYKESAPEQGVQVQPLSAEPDEAAFTLAPRPVGSFAANTHFLVVEWPVEQGDIRYMKEVEVIEILVTAHSLNRLEDPDYDAQTPPTEALEDTYTPGVIMLKEPASASSQVYPYTIDLRAFQQEAGNQRSFQFYVGNAVGHQFGQSRERIEYSMRLSVPLERIVGEDDTVSFRLLQMHYLLDETELSTVRSYYLRNEKTGEILPGMYTPEEFETLVIQPEQRPYAVYYSDALSGILENWKVNTANIPEQIASENLHTLTISGADVLSRITDASLQDDFSYQHKLELEIVADFRGEVIQPPDDTVPPETTAAATEAQGS